VIIVILLLLEPNFDFANGLFILLGYQASVLYRSTTRWSWVIGLVLLTGGSLMVTQGAVRGLALGLTNMAALVVISAYTAINQEIEASRAMSQTMLGKLEETHQQLQIYTTQVDELTIAEERQRLARDLHDSVSQTMFSILLNTEAAQILADQDPPRVQPQVELLHELTQNALAEMRGLIYQLRQK
jgi:signal transduction histidine kinase